MKKKTSNRRQFLKNAATIGAGIWAAPHFVGCNTVSSGSAAELEVDGGIGPETAGKVVAAGATVLVAGNAIFGSGDGVAASIARIRAAASAGR